MLSIKTDADDQKRIGKSTKVPSPNYTLSSNKNGARGREANNNAFFNIWKVREFVLKLAM